MRNTVLSCCLSMSMIAVGCGTTFKEKYHFRASGEGATNYYRVVIQGDSYFSQSQYASGFYDRAAVDNLFGELTGAKVTVASGFKPDGGPASSCSEPCADGTGKESSGETGSKNITLESLDGSSMENQRLVIFLSSNSNAIVDQIRAFVRSAEMQNSMVALISKDEARRLQQAKGRSRPAQARADMLAAELEAIAAAVESSASLDKAAADKAIRDALASLARSSASPDAKLPFASIDAARSWIQNNPRAFDAGGQE